MLSSRRSRPDTVSIRRASSPLAIHRQRVIKLSAFMPGAVKHLQTLRALDLTTAIVSNGSSERKIGKIEALGLCELVDVVSSRETSESRSPTPAASML